ncbi:MAG: hypothetical protein Q7V05_11455 [Methanoregula sp.]|nr:hypothetical protein [Methanoregula sp.]
MGELTPRERIAFEMQLAREQHLDPAMQRAADVTKIFQKGAQAVQEKVRSENPQPIGARPRGIRPGRGASSNVLPAMGSSAFGMGGGHIDFRGGSGVAYGAARGSSVDFGHGSAVDTRALNSRKFGMNDAVLEYSKPIFGRRKN